MTSRGEAQQIDDVIERLISRYPFRPAAEVAGSVRRAHERFGDCRIREFVPLLVEKAVRRELDGTRAVITVSTPDPSVRPADSLPEPTGTSRVIAPSVPTVVPAVGVHILIARSRDAARVQGNGR